MRWFLSFLLVVFCTGHGLCYGEGKRPVYSMQDCVKKVLSFSPELIGKRYDVIIAKTRQEEAESYLYPQIDSMAMLSAVPNARGTYISSPDTNNVIRGLGLFEALEITVVQPLYTFDKISSSIKAAKAGIKVEKSKLKQQAAELTLKIKTYYNGYVFALNARKLIEEIRRDLGKARKNIEKLIEQDADTADPMDLNKLIAYEGETDKFFFEAEKSQKLAKEALATFMGLRKNSDFEVKDKKLLSIPTPLAKLEYYIENAKKLRPEFKQIKEGLIARKNLVTAAKADKYPVIFIGGNLSIANADGRTDNENPFIYDPLNHFWGGVGLGARWHLDFGITNAKIDRAKAEYLKLKETRRYARNGIPLQVKKAYLETQEAYKNINSSERSYKAARKWLVASILNFDMGIGDAKDIFDALKIYASMKGLNLKSKYNYNVARYTLEHAAGMDISEVEKYLILN